MRRRSLDLVATVLYAGAATALVWRVSFGQAVGVLMVPLILVAPGYALTRALQGARQLGPLELATLTLTLSFATEALGGLVLNAFDVRLDAHAWSALALAVTASGALLAVIRRQLVSQRPLPALGRLSVRPGTLVVGTVTCALLVAAGLVAGISQAHLDRRESVTQLTVVPTRAVDGSLRLALSVKNSRERSAVYRLQVSEGGGPEISVDLRLRAGETWSEARSLPSGGSRPAVITLLRDGQPYRSVTVG